MQVKTEQQFYEAFQLYRAYCKLEVIDENGENRLVNRALYEGEHHELGIISLKMGGSWVGSHFVTSYAQTVDS